MENYVANVIPHLQQWWPVVLTLSYLVGLIFAIVSLFQSVDHKNKFNRMTAVWTFVSAVLLSNLPSMLDSMAMSIFNSGSEQSLSYSPPGSPGAVYIQFAVIAIRFVGLIGIARGICLLRGVSSQPGNLSRGIVHMVGGIIAVNLVTFLQGIGATIGGDVQSYIAKIIG